MNEDIEQPRVVPRGEYRYPTPPHSLGKIHPAVPVIQSVELANCDEKTAMARARLIALALAHHGLLQRATIGDGGVVYLTPA